MLIKFLYNHRILLMKGSPRRHGLVGGEGGLWAVPGVGRAQPTEFAAWIIEFSLLYPPTSGPEKAQSASWNELKWLRGSKVNWTDFRLFFFYRNVILFCHIRNLLSLVSLAIKEPGEGLSQGRERDTSASLYNIYTIQISYHQHYIYR